MTPAGHSENHDSLERPVLASLNRDDFDLARRFPGFSLWRTYEEFEQERDGLYIGYATAGVTPYIQPVSFAAFEAWACLTGASLDIDGLDEFAAHCRARIEHPGAPIAGRFRRPGDTGLNIVRENAPEYLHIRQDVYERWRDDIAGCGLFAPPSLDVYAALVVEFCLASDRRASRPAVSSA